MMYVTYEGNKCESGVITEVVEGLYSHIRKLGQNSGNIVFVFDMGNNSETNIPHIGNKFN